jgi:molecular chaperone DnaK
MSENKDKLDAAAQSDIEAAIAEAKTALSGDDADAMNAAFDKVQTASHKLAEVLYSAQGTPDAEGGEQASSASASGDGGTASAAGDEGDVIDAEYVDVDDENKQ